MGDAFKLCADHVGGEASGEEAAIERGKLALVELAAKVREPVLEAGADKRGLVGLGENGIERSFDVAIRDATGAEGASDAVASLTAQPGVMTGVLEGVAYCFISWIECARRIRARCADMLSWCSVESLRRFPG